MTIEAQLNEILSILRRMDPGITAKSGPSEISDYLKQFEGINHPPQGDQAGMVGGIHPDAILMGGVR